MLYVDKTMILHDYVVGVKNRYHFIARPRRFGKSLLCSTIGELFLGDAALFDGLHIKEGAKWDFKAEKRPVIHLDMSNLKTRDSSAEKMLQLLSLRLCELGKDHGIAISESLFLEVQLAYLIKQFYEKAGKKPVVVIIDEYDAPILDLAQSPTEQNIMREFLSTFYGQLKILDQYLRLVYITGIMKFTSMSLFSKLNNLDDHTFKPAFATICGYTKEEIHTNFPVHLQRYQEKFKRDSIDATIDILQNKYNGYCFGVDEEGSSELPLQVFNPFEINHALANADGGRRWVRSGHSQFLIDRIVDCKATGIALSKREISLSTLQQSCTADNLLPYDALMYYAGYSTIKSYNHETNLVTLEPPNDSISDDVLSGIIDAFTKGKVANAHIELARDVVKALFAGKAGRDNLVNSLNKVIATYPWQLLKYSQNNPQDSERVFNVFFSTFFKVGCSEPFYYLGNEIQTAYGSVEFAIENLRSKETVIGEFKVRENTSIASEGITKRSYHLAFPNRKLILIGINITEKRKAEVEVAEYTDVDEVK